MATPTAVGTLAAGVKRRLMAAPPTPAGATSEMTALARCTPVERQGELLGLNTSEEPGTHGRATEKTRAASIHQTLPARRRWETRWKSILAKVHTATSPIFTTMRTTRVEKHRRAGWRRRAVGPPRGRHAVLSTCRLAPRNSTTSRV